MVANPSAFIILRPAAPNIYRIDCGNSAIEKHYRFTRKLGDYKTLHEWRPFISSTTTSSLK